MSEEIFESIQSCIDDRSVYIDEGEFFNLLQDAGIDVNDDQRREIDARKMAEKKKKAKTFTRKILHDYKLSSDLYTLAEKIHKTWESNKDVHFEKLPNSATSNIHHIGTWIASKRCLVCKADFHTPQAEQHQLEFVGELGNVYFLSQADVIKHFKCKWGQSIIDTMKHTLNDKVRLGLLLFHDDIREYVPDMLSKTKAAPNGSNNTDNRTNYDACSSRKKRGKQLLLNLFKDADVQVQFPSAWKASAAREFIDKKKGVGWYSENAIFNPNDKSRIELPWTSKSLDVVYAKFFKEYNASLAKWTMGTGGGPGAPENFVVWQDRDPLYFINYPNQEEAHLYLTPVYMRDKEYSFLLVDVKDELPPGCQVEDNENIDDAVPSTAKKHTKEDETLSKLQQTVEAISAQKSLFSKELTNLLQGGDESASDIIDKIERTTKLVDNYNDKTSKLVVQKDAILNGEGSRSDKKRKLEPILIEIKENDKMVKHLKFTLKEHRAELAKANGEEEEPENYKDLFDDISIHSS